MQEISTRYSIIPIKVSGNVKKGFFRGSGKAMDSRFFTPQYGRYKD